MAVTHSTLPTQTPTDGGQDMAFYTMSSGDAPIFRALAKDLPDLVFAAGYCGICDPFPYARSVMTDPVQRATHLRDVLDLFADLENGTLASVAFVKMDGALGGPSQRR